MKEGGVRKEDRTRNRSPIKKSESKLIESNSVEEIRNTNWIKNTSLIKDQTKTQQRSKQTNQEIGQ